MPTRKPDQVITHRVELGAYERERLDSLIAAQSFNKVATPIVAGMSDVSFMVVLAGLLTLWGVPIVMPTGSEANEPQKVVSAIQAGVEVLIEEAQTAGQDSVWYNPASWKIFDFIGDIQARAFGIDRDNPDTGPISDLEQELRDLV